MTNNDLLNLNAKDITSKSQALDCLRAMGKTYDEDECCIRMARRELAVFKDKERDKQGIPAKRVYGPRKTKQPAAA